MLEPNDHEPLGLFNHCVGIGPQNLHMEDGFVADDFTDVRQKL